MTNTSFEITTSADFFHSLQEMAVDFQGDPISSRKAIAAFMFSYHLREWIWKEHQELICNNLGCCREADFNAYVNRWCPNFQLVRNICNGSKHFSVVEGPVVSSGLTGGSFSSGFNSEFNVGQLSISTASDTILVTQLLTEIISFYEKTFTQLEII